ncbi:hypothetical protein DPEC_G00223460 [Dallia pectoralis]|uniref:Uncharacterized protein n=1 Tax=Dallia pectoralis TaxID=75939 RepID=A0ACC2G047_DALPE|nr:hypothetical protein DPEC_G00223460 [Dallia pectoralis]
MLMMTTMFRNFTRVEAPKPTNPDRGAETSRAPPAVRRSGDGRRAIVTRVIKLPFTGWRCERAVV